MLCCCLTVTILKIDSISGLKSLDLVDISVVLDSMIRAIESVGLTDISVLDSVRALDFVALIQVLL